MNEPLSLPPVDRATRSAHFHSRLLRFRTRLRRHWWIPTLTLLAGLAVQAVIIRQQPPSFISLGQMIVSIKLSLPEGSVYNEEMSNFLGTQVALMQSAAVLSRAEVRLRATRPELTPVPVTLSVTVSPKTTIFVLRATGPEPLYTQAYLQACISKSHCAGWGWGTRGWGGVKREDRTGVSAVIQRAGAGAGHGSAHPPGGVRFCVPAGLSFWPWRADRSPGRAS